MRNRLKSMYVCVCIRVRGATEDCVIDCMGLASSECEVMGTSVVLSAAADER